MCASPSVDIGQIDDFQAQFPAIAPSDRDGSGNLPQLAEQRGFGGAVICQVNLNGSDGFTDATSNLASDNGACALRRQVNNVVATTTQPIRLRTITAMMAYRICVSRDQAQAQRASPRECPP